MKIVNFKDISIDEVSIAHKTMCSTIELDLDAPLSVANKSVSDQLNDVFDRDDYDFEEKAPMLYSFYLNLRGEGKITVDDFLAGVNTVLSAFFKIITTSEPTNREHRLDAPEALSSLNVCNSYIKNAVNFVTMRDNFNIFINFKKYSYLLIKDDTKLQN